MRHSGTIKSWNDEKGYGYVTSVGNGQPVCLHVRNFERRGQRPRQGMKVEFEIGSDVQGRCCATRVRLQGQTASIDIRFNPGLVGLALIALLALWWVGFAGFIPMLITLAVTFMSMLAFFLYWSDKLAAKRGDRRTPENTLHMIALCGGWPGALLAQQFLRHKSNKASFQTVYWLTVGINLVALGWLASDDGATLRQKLESLI